MATTASFRAPYTVAPYDTHLCVTSSDFTSTAAASFLRASPHDLEVIRYNAIHQRNLSAAFNNRIDPPFQVNLNEREIKQRDKIKTMFAIRKRAGKKRSGSPQKPKKSTSRKPVVIDGVESEIKRKPPVPTQKHRAV